MMNREESLGQQITEALNRDCYCIGVDEAMLHKSLAAHLADSGLPEGLVDASSNLFAESPVFLWQGHLEKMQQLIHAIERVNHNSNFQQFVLANTPAVARNSFGPHGVFFGYDFHLGADGPQLIEINTNAGGVLLNAYLAAAQKACCEQVTTFFGGGTRFSDVEQTLISMFKEEWHRQRPNEPLRTIAIVDNEPAEQFLHAEFLLFQSLFERHGIRTVIADPVEFSIQDNSLCVNDTEVDLVYNRLTDFYFQMPGSHCLKEAYQRELAVFSPSPHHYALYADKRNLVLLSDRQQLAEFGIDKETIDTLAQSVPKTMLVTGENADQLWKNRKQLFFKPLTGYGSRGAYRGAKLTRRVWDEIVQSDAYIAQAAVPPSERQLIINGETQSLKLDIRCVTYKGMIQQLSARLYRGQTTNLRTEGGGLATVFATPSTTCCSAAPSCRAEIG